jgi:hypothetical protein
MSKQIPEKSRQLMACPACGKTVEARYIFTGRHNRVCQPYVNAYDDAQPGSFQEKRRAELRQDQLAQKGMTFSERWADFVLQADFIRKRWAAALTTLMLLSWLVGYQTPNFGYWPTILTIPAVALVCLMLFFNKKVRTLFGRGPVKRV